MTTRTVALRDIKLEAEHWRNPRTTTGLDTDDIDALAADIKSRGLLDAPRIQLIKVGDKIVNLGIDGQRRVLAMRKVYTPDHMVEVIDHNPDKGAVELTPAIASQLLLDVLAGKSHRKPLSSYEDAVAAQQLREANSTVPAISKALHRSESWVARMLAAMKKASEKLVTSWRKGDITDEQFKELAELENKDEVVDLVKTLRDDNKNAEARTTVKELVHKAKAERKEKAAEEKAKKAPAPAAKKDAKPETAPAKARPEGPKRASTAELEDIVGLAKLKAPTSDYVKGVLDGVRLALGHIEQSKLGKGFATYVQRVSGAPAKPAAKKKAGKKKGK